MEQIVSRRFHIGDVISVIRQINISPRGITGLLDILSFLIQDTVKEEDIPKVMGWCTAALSARFEVFNASIIDREIGKYLFMLQNSEGEIDGKNLLNGLLASLTKKLGENRIVQPLSVYPTWQNK